MPQDSQRDLDATDNPATDNRAPIDPTTTDPTTTDPATSRPDNFPSDGAEASARTDGDNMSSEVRVVHSEKLWVPLWWWPVGLAVGALLAAEVHMGAPGVRAWLPYVLLLPLPVWALYWLSRMRVEVVRDASGGELRVGQAHLPLDVIGRTAVVPATAKSAALGRQLDPLAFVQHRTWVKQMVLIVLDDPDDPTPYWLVSTTRPDELVAALARPTPGSRT